MFASVLTFPATRDNQLLAGRAASSRKQRERPKYGGGNFLAPVKVSNDSSFCETKHLVGLTHASSRSYLLSRVFAGGDYRSNIVGP